ncbi:LacI family DNA-binding transcriptional regulator [Sphingomonas prati]|uniref:LacI family transcriptional regulator n=1 Tax=Sphingomonas prati TaxID=1843237 RepID=A0A7W9BUE5_9SPHN|nr:LacI family DNA-binding transcriptional regulator [Sphingomonas prati]MBB5730297.1 LacI family transcriptional regulator [Sphingomonas prati]GGE93031.1 LacI family transcriptional regulator [Sphingomonas prati]
MARKAGPARSTTIVDVAAQAGVSPMTVSRVINDRTGVGAETRAAVQEAIRALGYRPNVAARSLVMSAELRIGVVYSNPSAAFMSDFLTGVFEEASARGARLVLLKGEGGRPPAEDALRDLIASGVSGVILTPPLGESPAVLRVLREAGLPMASVGAHQVADTICVRIDDRKAAYEMTRELIALGHRRLGFIVGNPDQAASAERLAGFHAAVREVDGVQTAVAQGDFSYASGLVAGEQLLDAPVPPTAIFASNDDMAAAIVSVAHRRQLDVPGELTVVGFDDTTAAVMLWPPLTTVHQPVRRLAAEALGLLATEIAGGGDAVERADRVLAHGMVRRQSTAAPRG